MILVEIDGSKETNECLIDVMLGGLRPPLATRQARHEAKRLRSFTLTLGLSKGEGGRSLQAGGDQSASTVVVSLAASLSSASAMWRSASPISQLAKAATLGRSIATSGQTM